MLWEENTCKIFMEKTFSSQTLVDAAYFNRENDRNKCQALEIKVQAAYLAETKRNADTKDRKLK